jgi:hypothetical protein
MALRDTIKLDHRSQCVLEKALMTLRVLERPSWALGIVTRAAVRCWLSLGIKMNSQNTLWMEHLQPWTNCIMQKRISYDLETCSLWVNRRDLKALHRCGWRFPSSETLCRIDWKYYRRLEGPLVTIYRLTRCTIPIGTNIVMLLTSWSQRRSTYVNYVDILLSALSMFSTWEKYAGTFCRQIKLTSDLK